MVKLKDGVVSVGVEGQCVIVNSETGRYHVSNRIAYEMMAALASADLEEAAVSELLGILDIDPNTLRNDFALFQEQLLELDLAVAG